MEFWLLILPIIIYVLLIVLLIVGIVLGIKAINAIDKVSKVIDNVNEKFESLNPVFSIIDFATDRLAGLSDRVVEFFTSMLGKLLMKRKRKDDLDA